MAKFAKSLVTDNALDLYQLSLAGTIGAACILAMCLIASVCIVMAVCLVEKFYLKIFLESDLTFI